MNPDTLPPHSLPDESGVLSCVLQDSNLCLPDCVHVTEKCFFDLFNREVWLAIRALEAQRTPVNEIGVLRILDDQKVENATLRLMELVNASPSPHNLPYYLPTLFEKATKRRIVKACQLLTDQAMNGSSLDQVMASVEKLLAIQPANATPILDGKQNSKLLMDDLERRFNLQGALPGLDTGFHALNAKLDGLQFGEQTLIAARPSIGKTAVGLGIFAHTVFSSKVPALFVSLEMSAAALMRRMLSTRSEIKMGDLRHGNYTEGTFAKFTAFAHGSSNAPLYILDGVCGLTINEICAAVRRHVRRCEIKLVVVDYLQKITPAERHEKRTYEVGAVSGKLRALAVETGAAFLTLAQLNRESEKDKKPRTPRLSDLADSGQIERDADTVILLDRNREESSGEAFFNIAKQRDGETGYVKVRFNGSLCRFENISQIDPADYPQPYNDP